MRTVLAFLAIAVAGCFCGSEGRLVSSPESPAEASPPGVSDPEVPPGPGPTADRLRIVTPYLQPGTAGQSYTALVQARGGTPPYGWTIEAAIDGVAFDASTATLSGVPAESGYYDLRVVVTDASAPTQKDAYRYQLLVVDLPPASGETVISTPKNLPAGYVGESYNLPFEMANRSSWTSFQIATLLWFAKDPARLPPGLSVSMLGGFLAGSPTTPGGFDFVVRAEWDSNHPSFEKAVRLEVRPSRKVHAATALDPLETAHGFVAGPALDERRFQHTVTSISGGRFLVAGGGTGAFRRATKIFDATAGFSDGSEMLITRLDGTATALADGRVLFAGGSVTGYFPGAEIYDPAADRFVPAGGAWAARSRHVAARLANGDVLVAGGQETYDTPFGVISRPTVATAEIYEVAKDAFRPTGSLLEPLIGHRATLLADARVLVTGGTSLEVYDPADGTFAFAGTLNVPRFGHDAVLLKDGRVLVTGGWSAGTASRMLRSAEIYDPATKTSTEIAPMFKPRRGHASARLPDGRVLLIVGGAIANPENLVPPAYEGAEVFDPTAETFTPVHTVFQRWGAVPVLLQNGVVAAIGGATNPWGGPDRRSEITELYLP